MSERSFEIEGSKRIATQLRMRDLHPKEMAAIEKCAEQHHEDRPADPFADWDNCAENGFPEAHPIRKYIPEINSFSKEVLMRLKQELIDKTLARLDDADVISDALRRFTGGFESNAFDVGTDAVVCGLRKRPDLNGLKGKIVAHGKGRRLAIQLTDRQKPVLVLPENLVRCAEVVPLWEPPAATVDPHQSGAASAFFDEAVLRSPRLPWRDMCGVAQDIVNLGLASCATNVIMHNSPLSMTWLASFDVAAPGWAAGESSRDPLSLLHHLNWSPRLNAVLCSPISALACSTYNGDIAVLFDFSPKPTDVKVHPMFLESFALTPGCRYVSAQFPRSKIEKQDRARVFSPTHNHLSNSDYVTTELTTDELGFDDNRVKPGSGQTDLGQCIMLVSDPQGVHPVLKGNLLTTLCTAMTWVGSSMLFCGFSNGDFGIDKIDAMRKESSEWREEFGGTGSRLAQTFYGASPEKIVWRSGTSLGLGTNPVVSMCTMLGRDRSTTFACAHASGTIRVWCAPSRVGSADEWRAWAANDPMQNMLAYVTPSDRTLNDPLVEICLSNREGPTKAARLLIALSTRRFVEVLTSEGSPIFRYEPQMVMGIAMDKNKLAVASVSRGQGSVLRIIALGVGSAPHEQRFEYPCDSKIVRGMVLQSKFLAFKTSEPRLYRVSLDNNTRSVMDDMAKSGEMAMMTGLLGDFAASHAASGRHSRVLRPAAIAQEERDRGLEPTRYPRSAEVLAAIDAVRASV